MAYGQGPWTEGGGMARFLREAASGTTARSAGSKPNHREAIASNRSHEEVGSSTVGRA